MQRPEVRIIDYQREEITPADISLSEQEALLAKYGYSSTPLSYNSGQNTVIEPVNDLSFEEMCRLEEVKKRDEMSRKNHQRSGPKPITFDGDYYSETKYDSQDGMSYKINIVTNIR